ncbi:MAG: hypothetical protein ACTSV1_00810 [Alphaproteobacteria bacterium]
MNYMSSHEEAEGLIQALEELGERALDEKFPMTAHLIYVAADSIRSGYGRDTISGGPAELTDVD